MEENHLLTSYINHSSKEIKEFIDDMKKGTVTVEEVFHNIFKWFDENVKYSRLTHPYFPLQRSDIDVLTMKSGTCGDYSNLIVSALINLGIPAKYAYLSKDCYGNEQDHICAAAYLNEKWILIDATMPYRKWFGFDCPHQEFELLDVVEFEYKMKKIEKEFFDKAVKWGNEQYAGLLYAPWVYDEIIASTDEKHHSVFFLLICNSITEWTLYINYLSYTKESAKNYIMVTIKKESRVYQFSMNESMQIWDSNQWSKEYDSEQIPEEFKSEELDLLNQCIDCNLEIIVKMIP